MKRLVFRFLLTAFIAGAFVAVARHGTGCSAPQRVEWPVMGTIAGLSFRGEKVPVDRVRTSVQTVYERLNGLLSAWDEDSELSRFAKAGCTNWCDRVTEEVRPCYRLALDLADRSRKAFNPYVGARLRELGFSHGQPFCDFDLGAIAKGFAVDRAYDALVSGRDAEPDDLLLDLGGNLRVVGGVWRTGVRNPFGEGYAGVIALTNGEATATSGNYERFVEREGVRYSHILDGRTGEPVTGIAGVTVIAPTAMLADGLSTTLFVLGPTAGATFLHRNYPAVPALWIPDTPAAPRILATPQMAERLVDAPFPVLILSRP